MSPADDTDQLLARKHALELRVSDDAQLAQRLHELRVWQTVRLARTYSDLHGKPRYSAAIKFFLQDLYGPHDFTQRDQGVAHAWQRLKRALPAKAAAMLTRAIELDVLTTELDHAMAAQLPPGPLTRSGYAIAYRAVGQPEARRRQLALILEIGADLEQIVQHHWIGVALKAAHVPAHAAGFGALQSFLERGYASFRRARGAVQLLDTIRVRETQLMNALFSGAADPFNLFNHTVRGSQ